jgi:hypothetical protein
MTARGKFPARIQSKVLGELAFNSVCEGYVPLNDRDPESPNPGSPNFIIWVPPANRFVPSDFVAMLDQTWESLFTSVDRVLKAATPVIAEEIVRFTGIERETALKLAKQLAQRDKIAMVKLNLDGTSNSRHELQLSTVGTDEEVGDHDLYVCLGRSFEPTSVYLDG